MAQVRDDADGLSRRALLTVAVAALAIAGLGAAAVFATGNGRPFGIDSAWMGEMLEHRTQWWTRAALTFDRLGGGIVATLIVPLIVAAGLLMWRYPWGALCYVAATAVSALAVQAIKHAVARPRPEDILVHSDFGSFPSGHSANAATMTLVLAVILRRRWVWIAGITYTVSMMLSRTYLGAHWISDTVAGALVGAGIAAATIAALASKVVPERSRAAGARGRAAPD